MSILSIKPISARLVVTGSLLLLAACASQPTTTQPGKNAEQVVSKYAAQRKGEAAGASNTKHIPVVPHTPEAAKQAKAALSDYVLGLKAMQNKQYEKALIIFQSISSRYTLLSGPLVNEGMIYLQQKKPKDAKRVLLQATQINAKNPYAWNALGVTYRKLGEFKKAKRAYQAALKLDPLYARAQFNLAVLADLYLDDLPLALEHYQRYQSLQKTPDKSVGIWIVDLKRRIKKAHKNNATQAEGVANNAATETQS